MKYHEKITDAVGKTPLVKLNFDDLNKGVNIFAKLEYQNPLGSVKDRPSKYMIMDAEEKGLLSKNTVIIEATSGNTGIGLASVCAAKGYRLILTMPESMSLERRKLLTHLGAEIVLTDKALGMKGAISKVNELKNEFESVFIPDQFSNPANVRAHMETTAVEIWDDLSGDVDVLVSGVGTGGTITGVSRFFKERKDEFVSVAVEPLSSPVLSGGKPSPHKIQGIGAGFVPGILDVNLIDRIEKVSDEDAIDTARMLASKFGLLCGISSGAAMSAALKVAKQENYSECNIVVVLPSTGERYLSTDLFLS